MKKSNFFTYLFFFFMFMIHFNANRVWADDENIIFLHHSTGSAVYNYGDVPGWFTDYNNDNGTSYTITKRGYPSSPYSWKNYPYDYWNLWVNNACDSSQPGIECIDTLTANYNVIIFKHCYPGADILADTGSPSISSERKSLENYKLQYRALRDMADRYPNNIFIFWTLAPKHRLATNSGNASRAKQFVDWVKNDFLTEDGQTHPNIFLFDFWGIVAEQNPSPANGEVNCLKYEYEKSHTSSDSHPNLLANQTAGPLFAQYIVDSIEQFNSGSASAAVISSPVPSSTLGSTGITFTWNNSGASQYWLWIGTSAGNHDVYSGDIGTNTSAPVSGLPANQETLYARLWSEVDGEWLYNDYTYTACDMTAEIQAPTPGSALGSSSQTFTWDDTGVSGYWLWIGTSAGSHDVYSGNQGTDTSAAVSGLPANGETLYVRLWSQVDGVWIYNTDQTYTACDMTAGIQSPTPGSTLGSASVTFTWNDSGASKYWLWVGTSAEGHDIYSGDQGTNTSKIVSDLPDNGETLYIRLWSVVDGYWLYNDYTYTAVGR
ncbi:MAG: hypothetical protein GY749_10470 [Desulfobacteraceae bacterium]|nr:hypothetical protein [Desulfobacteraceae bacterium]